MTNNQTGDEWEKDFKNKWNMDSNGGIIARHGLDDGETEYEIMKYDIQKWTNQERLKAINEKIELIKQCSETFDVNVIQKLKEDLQAQKQQLEND